MASAASVVLVKPGVVGLVRDGFGFFVGLVNSSSVVVDAVVEYVVDHVVDVVVSVVVDAVVLLV